MLFCIFWADDNMIEKFWVTEFGSLYHGDALEILPSIKDETIDAIITDPPYERKYMHLYPEIAKHAQRILKPGGSFLTIIPHYNIPYIMEEVGKYLKFRWLCCMWQDVGHHKRMSFGVEVMWKPIGWWTKGTFVRNFRGYVRDGFANTAREKDLHKWQQNKEWSDYCMHFVEKGDIVLDPLFGSGTIALSCIDKEVGFIGIEEDTETINKAKNRIEEYIKENR